MKIENVEGKGSSLSFTLKDASPSYANAVRRIAINGVRTFAIDKITFYENTSAMFDEYISHRIGLVPITTPNKGYNDTDEIVFTLEAAGPKTVYSKDIESSDKDVKVAIENIPVIKLAENQRLRIECKAVMSTADKHAKFQPGLVTYEKKGDNFDFYVESFGQMSAKEIINKTFDVIKEEMKELQKEAKKL